MTRRDMWTGREESHAVEWLRQIPVFLHLSERSLRLLSGLLSRREVGKGEALYREGQPCEKFIILLEGRLNVLKTSIEGREKVVAELRPNEHFGLAEIVTGQRSNATIEAAEPGEILTLSKDDFVRTLLDNPRMCFQLMQTMAATIMELSDQIQEVSFEPVGVRLARLLVTLADREGRDQDGRLVIRRRHSHQDLARRLGASRETVTRALKRFKELNLASTEGRTLVVLDREGLLEVIRCGGLDEVPHGPREQKGGSPGEQDG